MKKEQIISDIQTLLSYGKVYEGKCRRNFKAYEWSRAVNITNFDDSDVVGFSQTGWSESEPDTTTNVSENIIKSCIDTLTSKIASQKVRPFFNTINGTFKDMSVTKQAQQFFDVLFDEKNVNNEVTDAFKNSTIFDKGVIFIDKNDVSIRSVLPYQVYVDPREVTYGKPTRVVWKRNQYPTTLLNVKAKTDIKTVTYYRYWDTKNHIEVEYIPEINHYKETVWQPDVLPFIWIYYQNPVKGNTSSSVVDMLYGIAMEIDTLMQKVKDASQLSSPLKYLVPEQSNIKVDKLSNRTGEVIKYTYLPNMSGSPITVATEPLMDPSWMQTISTLKQDAYELVGISQLSASSQKPKGLNSGVALSTMEDIESDRYQTQLNSVVRLYTDIAKTLIQILPGDADILPTSMMNSSLKWSDVLEMKEKMRLQFSAAESLSKDPSEKLKQLQALVGAGVIPQSRMATLMELPDLQQGYSLSNNSINAVLQVINNCIDNDIYDIPVYIYNPLLKDEILSTCLSLTNGREENKPLVDKLMKLYIIAMKRDVNAQTTAEMNAVNQLQSELTADITNPSGIINSSMNQMSQNIALQNAQLQASNAQAASLMGGNQ